jgi:asparagine synthase (glutamine-hydrolysing)
VANFLAVVDPDTDRRGSFIERARARLAPIEGLRLGSAQRGDLAFTWAAGERAPLDYATEGDAAAFVVGDAWDGPTPTRLAARSLLAGWPLAADSSPAAFDGFHAALRFDPRAGLTAGADVLGLFPIYHASRGGVLVLGSSPELFELHPLFPSECDLEGLVGLLLAHAVVDGKTLFRHVRLLAPGHVLEWKDGVARERLSYRITSREGLGRLSFAEQLDLLDEAHAQALDRQVPMDSLPGMLLSGGLDTRLLSGYLTDARAPRTAARGSSPIPALTFGRASDYEVRCARALATRLGMRHRVVDLSVQDLSKQADLQLRWQNLAAGFSNVHTWSFIEPLSQMPTRFVTGYLASPIGPAAQRGADFDALMASPEHRGFTTPQLERLLLPRLHSLVHERHEWMRRAYLESSDRPHERSWRFDLVHRLRAHPGGAVWRFSFASWPVLPILDRALLDLFASVPLSTLADRRAQEELVRTRFPALARLPLDRFGHDTLPLAPSRARGALNPWIVRARHWRARARERMGAGLESERRYYPRIFDIRGTGWQRLREAAEPHRDRLSGIFDMEELRRWLPPPSVEMKLIPAVRESYRPKLLIGLMLWAADHPL